MKKLLVIFLAAFSASCLHAQSIDRGGICKVKDWYNGNLNYSPELQGDGSILFTACDEGQDLAFLFTPKPGRKDEYLVTDGHDVTCVNPFPHSSRARHVRNDGLNLLCLYDGQGLLRDVLSPAEYELGEAEAERKWARQLMGGYTSAKGEPMVMRMTGSIGFQGTELPYRHITFNGTITGLIEIKGGTRLEGLWDVKITRDGLKFTKVTTDDEYYRFVEPTGEEELFTWAYNDVPRFDYASKILLNDNQFRKMDKSLLRILRNEIWFHHGYAPSSVDLQEYLTGKEWYTPRASNDGIADELSVIETLNIELIKAGETLKELEVKAFNFEKYHPVIEEMAQANLNYMKSTDDVRLVSYALIDIDNDGISEVWVKGDEGQDFQGVFAVSPGGDVSLLMSSDARSELKFYPCAIAAEGYYGEGEFRGSVCTVEDSRQDQYGSKHVRINNYSPDMEVLQEGYTLNDKDVTEAEYDAFIKDLGRLYQPQVEWNLISSTK